MGPSGRRFDPCHSDQILTESRVYSPLSAIFYADLSVLPPLLKKSRFYDHIIKCGLEISFSLFTAAQNLKSQTSNRHGFFRGGVVSALRRSSRFKPFFLSRNFRILLFNHLGKPFFTFFSCVGVDIKLFAFAVWQFWRITPFPFLFADSKYAPRSGTAYLRLFRLKFRSYGRFLRLVGCLPVPTQSALISAETPFDFVGGGALHIVGNMGIYNFLRCCHAQCPAYIPLAIKLQFFAVLLVPFP